MTSIVVLALGLRKLMQKAIEDLHRRHEVPWQQNGGSTKVTTVGRGGSKKASPNALTDTRLLTHYSFESFNDFNLEYLLTYPSKQKEVLN